MRPHAMRCITDAASCKLGLPTIQSTVVKLVPRSQEPTTPPPPPPAYLGLLGRQLAQDGARQAHHGQDAGQACVLHLLHHVPLVDEARHLDHQRLHHQQNDERCSAWVPEGVVEGTSARQEAHPAAQQPGVGRVDVSRTGPHGGFGVSVLIC